ncbi:acyltransferase family protein [Ramlibacter albus]|uniref:Acyltransferase family protein n=1 Tax=Ramlibacter albus TaxID=2079448 RepID=A0A923M5D6_9BURK|nr:acyltransferase family protein [Ramlibacter albus]MBC5763228.1 acyltransferase family protein [Ramlibacter albus]
METRPAPDPAPARLYALDNLRALMMWLGIVLHVGIIHMVQNAPLPWRDDRRTALMDLVVPFIHAFRMPVFFILAGFFVALLLQSRGASGMARHRAMRLALPFVVFWPVVYAASVVFALLYLHRIQHGTWGMDPNVRVKAPDGQEAGLNTMHMWFLWVLFIICMLTAVAARWLPKSLWVVPARVLQGLGGAWWGPVVLALPLVAVGLGHPFGLMRPSGRFLPPLTEFLHNGLFFAFGLALFHQQWDLFALYKRRWPGYAIAGVVPFIATGALMEAKAAAVWTGFAYNLATWLWSFAAIGLALRFLDKRHAVLGYLADSSYWVYLIHMPLTIGFGALLYGTPLPALAKILINIAATTVVCVATYHLLVRFTWVSVLLNGKRHPRPARPSSGAIHASP